MCVSVLYPYSASAQSISFRTITFSWAHVPAYPTDELRSQLGEGTFGKVFAAQQYVNLSFSLFK